MTTAEAGHLEAGFGAGPGRPRHAEEGTRQQASWHALLSAVASSALANRNLSQALADNVHPVGGDNLSSARLVREHQLEIFVQSFPVLVAALAVLTCLAAPATLGLLIWVVVSFTQEDKHSCDVPLRTWAMVEFIGTLYSIVHTPIIHCILRFTCLRQEEHDDQILPWHVRVYTLSVSVFDCIWISVGLHWVRTSQTCHATSPELYRSVRAYASFSMAFFVIVATNAMGLYSILSWMLRNGMLTSREAALPGTLRKLQTVSFDPDKQMFKDAPDCSICLGAFSDGSSEIRITHCGHLFHGRCLGNWLRMKRACPLCRRDVSDGSGEAEPVGRAAETTQIEDMEAPHSINRLAG